MEFRKMYNAFTVGSVLLLAAAISGASMVYPGASAAETQSFIGTTPDASGPDIEAPTF